MAGQRKMYVVIQHITANRYGMFVGLKGTAQGEPVLACASEEKAIGLARKLEQEARKLLPPFTSGDPDTWSSLGLKELAARLEKLGLRDLPSLGIAGWKASRHWRRWWDEHGGDLTPEQVDAIWKLLDQVELYRVVEVAVKG